MKPRDLILFGALITLGSFFSAIQHRPFLSDTEASYYVSWIVAGMAIAITGAAAWLARMMQN